MRALIATVFVVGLLGFVRDADAAKKHFDTTTAAYQALPDEGRVFIEKLATAIDAQKVNALIKLFPEGAYVGDDTYVLADLKKAIKKYGGVVKAFGVAKGAWTLEQTSDAWEVYRGEATAVFTINPGEEDGWLIRGVYDRTSLGDPPENLLHPPPPKICSGTEPYQAKLANPKVSAGLDAQIVRRYLRRNLSKIQYCYEKRLLADPSLAGTVSVSYTIQADGKVTATKASGVDGEVSSCIGSVLGSIEYPKPVDGAEVAVSYDFVLGNAGAGLFDLESADCTAMPKALVTFAIKVATAYDADDQATFLGLLAARPEVFGVVKAKKKIKKDIADAGSIASWAGLGAGTWSLEMNRDGVTLSRSPGRGRIGNPMFHFVLKKAGGSWKITKVVDPCAGGEFGCGGGGWGYGTGGR